MKKFRILLDIDDTVSQCVPAMLALYNHEHQDSLTPESITNWDINSFLKNGVECNSYFSRPGFFSALEPIPGALEGIQELMADGHEVIFVTACKYGHLDKPIWLQKNVPGWHPDNIVFTKRKDVIMGDIFIDDGPHNLEAFNSGFKVCFSRPWNQEYEGPRILNWTELVAHVRHLADFASGKNIARGILPPQTTEIIDPGTVTIHGEN